MFRYSETSVEENTRQVGVFEDGQRTAMAIIKEIVNMGGVDPETEEEDVRFIFGVYRDRQFSYHAIPEEITYITRLTDGRIESAAGGFPSPWTVVPGQWLLVEDVFIGKLSAASRPSEDPKMIFIESVTYNAPYGLSIKGGRSSTFKNRIERLGLGGF